MDQEPGQSNSMMPITKVIDLMANLRLSNDPCTLIVFLGERFGLEKIA
jgi:hypothetical protein